MYVQVITRRTVDMIESALPFTWCNSFRISTSNSSVNRGCQVNINLLARRYSGSKCQITNNPFTIDCDVFRSEVRTPLSVSPVSLSRAPSRDPDPGAEIGRLGEEWRGALNVK